MIVKFNSSKVGITFYGTTNCLCERYAFISNDFLENFGYYKHTLWRNIYNDFSSIIRFYDKLGFEYYNSSVTKEYVDEIFLKDQKRRNKSLFLSHSP